MKKLLVLSSAAALFLAGCASDGISRRVVSGAAIGAAAGGALGTLAGGDDGRNAAIGAAVGAIAGAAVGDYMDRQEAILREQTQGTGIEVVRDGDQIYLNTPADVTFRLSSAEIQPQFYGPLSDVAATLIDFPSTAVDVIGHASTDGPADFNLDLSERRAFAVADYLSNQGVRPVRFSAYGLGETEPLPGIPGTDPSNRRVEIVLTPIVEEEPRGYYN